MKIVKNGLFPSLNQWVEGSIPSGRTIYSPKDLLRFKVLASLFVSITICFLGSSPNRLLELTVDGCALWSLNYKIELV